MERFENIAASGSAVEDQDLLEFLEKLNPNETQEDFKLRIAKLLRRAIVIGTEEDTGERPLSKPLNDSGRFVSGRFGD